MQISPYAKSNCKVGVFGEAIIDLIEQQPNCYRSFIGGSPFNVARGFVNQELDCVYLSPISNDKHGEQISALAKQCHIQTINALRSAKPTSLALVYKDHNEQPDYRLYRSDVADLDIDTATLFTALPEDLSLFHTGSLAIVPSMKEVLLPVLAHLRSRGCAISMDINIRKGVEIDHNDYVASVWELAKHADVLKFSDEDLILCGITEDPVEYAKRYQSESGCRYVVLTLGDNGAYLFTQHSEHFQANFAVEQFVDAVGAGDTFFSAFIAELIRLNGFSNASDNNLPTSDQLANALAYGSMAASLNVQQAGCKPPLRAAVVERLR